MARLPGPIAAVLAAALIVVGCAVSAPADLTPEVDPNLPGIDAAYSALPGEPDHKDAGTSSGEPADSSTEPPAPVGDSGTDAAVPPAVPKPSAGEVLITEVMYTTSGPEPLSEWVELHSIATSPRTLAGLLLKDGSNRTHVIVGPLTIAPNAWVVLARNKAAAITAKVPALAIVYEYGKGLSDNSGILLANGSTGAVSLLNGAAVIATAPYGGWFTASGSSVQLKVLDGTQSSLKASWCLSPAVWAAGSEKGTPGAACDCP